MRKLATSARSLPIIMMREIRGNSYQSRRQVMGLDIGKKITSVAKDAVNAADKLLVHGPAKVLGIDKEITHAEREILDTLHAVKNSFEKISGKAQSAIVNQTSFMAMSWAINKLHNEVPPKK